MALETATTLRECDVAGLTRSTISAHASTISGLSLRAQGLRPLQSGPQHFLVAQAVRELDPETRAALVGERSIGGLVQPLVRTFDTLRLHDVTPREYLEIVEGSPRQTAQSRVFARYEEMLDTRDLYDTATLLRTATREVQDLSSSASGVFAVVDTMELTLLEKSFLSTLFSAESSVRAYRVGTHRRVSDSESGEISAPPNSVAVQFPDLSYPPDADASPSRLGILALDSDAAPDLDRDSIECWTATGARREVQAVFEDIVDRNRRLDSVEIAFASEDPYLPLIDILAERYEIPVSLSTGRALSATRPGQALQGFFDWIAKGFPVSELIGLLRADLLHLDEPIGPDGEYGILDSDRAATLLAERRYGDGATAYDDALSRWIRELETDLDDLQDAEDEAPWIADKISETKEQIAAIETLRGAIDVLLPIDDDLAPTRMSISRLASWGEKTLENVGPTPKPMDDDGEDTPDEVARQRLIERLQVLQEMTELPARRLRSLATQMSNWVELTPYIGARRPRPGEAHVVPLESAGYADRDHLYVVGLDATSTAAHVTNDPLLTDDERTALSGEDHPLPLRGHQADAGAWLIARALGRHEGTTTLSASTYNLAEEEERFEAPIFLRIQEALASEQPAERKDGGAVRHHPVASRPSTALTPLDGWANRDAFSPSTVSRAMKETYPWLHEGVAAESARASSEYTVYDGLLAPGDYDRLDPLTQSAPVSAGRLEAYARAPYAYFLQYILDVEPLDEAALEDVAWLNALDRGAVLHDTFHRFMSNLGRQPTRDDEPALRSVFERELEDKREEVPPPSEVVYASTRRDLWADAVLFLNAEASREDPHTPDLFEWAFGMPPHRQGDDDPGPASVDLLDRPFRLRGRIDRIDRHPEGRVSLWDYKTGSSRSFDEGDLLQNGTHLQWALYSYALEALRGERVQEAGYFFTSTREMGRRLSANPRAYRREVANVLKRMSTAISGGVFPVTDADELRYNYDRLFHEYRERTTQLGSKEWPTDRRAPPPLAEE